MTTSVIITLCVLLLFAYVFDITSSKTKIPSVILLLVLGWGVKEATVFFKINIPDLSPILPILGTIGLILIVLDGALELELNKSKMPLIGKSSLISFLTMIILSFGLAFAFQYYGNITLRVGLINAIPFAIISSAVAIPSAQNLIAGNKEFVTYESSLSDIFGVIFFNFIVLNQNYGIQSFGNFFVELIVMLIVTFVAILGLAFLLSKIKHHVKFAPIIIMIVLIYAITKSYHLPALIYILLFGLFLGNLDEMKRFKFIQRLQPDILDREVLKFKELTSEITFLIRALFFLLFGFLIETSELLNSKTILWAVGIILGIFLIRFILLKLFKLPIQPLQYIAPRGLITILLFLSIPVGQTTEFANKSLITQVIILSALVMMFGLVKHSPTKEESGD